MVSEPQVAPDLSPQGRLPAIDFERLRTERGIGYRRIGLPYVVGGQVLRPEIESALFTLPARRQSVDRQTQIGQHVVVDNVVEEHGIRIEGFLRQDDAIVKCLVVLANRPVLSNWQHERYSMPHRAHWL